MKFSLSVLLALAGTLLSQAAVTVVSGNVYDVGKYTFCQDSGLEGDDPMCWAASAANIIQHWQDTYSDFADPGQTVPNGTQGNNYIYPRGTGELKVYQQILQDWELSSGVPYNPITWWMKGPSMDGMSPGWCYYPSRGLKLNYPSGSPAPAAYYKKLFGSAMPKYATGLQNAPFYSLQIDKFGKESTSPKLADIRTTLLEAFEVQGQAVSLLVQGVGSTSGHAISCWGYETQKDAQGKEVITSLILSDSDDRKFGTFIVNLSQAADGTATIQTDRYNSWYHGDYAIKDVVYIVTPDTTPEAIGKYAAGTTVATARAPQTKIEDLSEPILSSCCLTKSVDTTSRVTIGGGTDDHGADVAVVFTTADDAAISIHDDTDEGALLTVADGGMALLYGGLSLQGKEEREVQGAEVLGHLYIHGGKVDIEACHTTNTAGAALHGGVLDDTYGIFTTDGLYATSYIEVRHAGSVSIHDNASEVSSDTFIGGGAVSAEDSFSFRDNESVVINDNSIRGYFVYGGGAFARMEATLSGNTELEMSGNKVVSSSCIAEGGALAAMFTNVCGNGDVSFTKNEAWGDNNGEYAALYPDPATGEYTYGANGRGGAIAVTFPSAISDTSGKYKPAELLMDGNGRVTFSQNLAEASFSDTISYNANASGGALYVGNLLRQTGEPVGAVASISGNTAGVLFDGNQALADSYRLQKWGGAANGVARGGAAYVAEQASLSIDSNTGGVTFSNNVAEGSEIAQGGGIYNAGKLQITHNDAVEFSNNTAKEGSHIYNETGATAEIAWNGKVLFSGASVEDSTVVNKGKMFLAAGQGKEIQFHNTMLDTTQGTLTLGSDASDNVNNTTLAFTADNTAATPAARTAVSSRSGLAADLSGLSLSVDTIVSGAGKDVYLDNVAVATNTDLEMQDMTLGTNVQLAETAAGHTLTLSNVEIDLSGASLTSTANGQGGRDYVFDLRGMLSGSVTLSKVAFDAGSLLGEDIDFINKDRVCMMFGDAAYLPDKSDGITISMVGSGGSTKTYDYASTTGGNVYFGGYFEVPEPATGTLGLLALAALAARRRKW